MNIIIVMNWLNFFDNDTMDLKHQFGRGINANLSENEDVFFDKSYVAFEEKNILDAYCYFFKTLENFSLKKSNDNIIVSQDEDRIKFELYQGTAKVTGYVTKEHLYAEVTITKKKNAHVALKRYILERNYQLTYSKYFCDDEYIKLKLYHDNITANPQKIFYPIREIALNADFDKEYMKSEFPDTVLEDIDHLKPIEIEELKIKYDFVHKWIKELEDHLVIMPTNDSVSMQSFLYLTILLKIDYLITPGYDIYQDTAKKIQKYFTDDNSLETNNEKLYKYILELKNIKFEEFKDKFYNSKYTFNPTEKASNEEIINFIEESLVKVRWYKNNRYKRIIPVIYEYIAFHILYNYGIHPVIRHLLHTLVEVQNPDFFKKLGYKKLYDEQKDEFSKKIIISNIENIITPYQKRFKSLKPFGDKLDFSSLNEFSNSFYIQLKHLDFEEI